jgi:hypothetical protein
VNPDFLKRLIYWEWSHIHYVHVGFSTYYMDLTTQIGLELNEGNISTNRTFQYFHISGSKKSIAICCFLTQNEIITENEKKVNILIAFQ